MKIALFLVLACFGLAASYATFKMRYGWYQVNEDAHFLDIGFLTGAGVIVSLWALFPSRVAVAVVGAVIFVFPPVLKQETFAAMDIPFAALSLFLIALLVLVTHLRRVWIGYRLTS
ncbi:hypothetical protein J2T07_000843 [Luteibacter jiangsuensis]|uniref:Uncharacterized protein n=1 Tax=Luteibacter jiangsuensis TaxID=637577 RepID=A0ABT9SUM8_9GAMM|nr:hypothetical protein [Luteibacter jiangsuensis]MDQ0008684.1 hypothetical protein [Luteibacter jiangsuensis]